MSNLCVEWRDCFFIYDKMIKNPGARSFNVGTFYLRR